MLFFEKKVEFTFLHGFNASKWQTIPTQLRLECTYAHIALIFFVLVYRLLSVASAASVPLRGSTCNGRKRAASEKKPNTLTLTACIREFVILDEDDLEKTVQNKRTSRKRKAAEDLHESSSKPFQCGRSATKLY
ncbi:unnamed protein product, partial [Ceratitis capitata]